LQDKVLKGDEETIRTAYNNLKANEKVKLLKKEYDNTIEKNKEITRKINDLTQRINSTIPTKVGDILNIYNDQNVSDYKVKVLEITRNNDHAILKVITSKKKEYTLRVESDGSTKTGQIDNFVFEPSKEDVKQLRAEKENLKSQLVSIEDYFNWDSAYSKVWKNYFTTTQPTVEPVGPVSQTNKPKGVEVKEGIYVNQGALTKEEQLELFDYLKPYLEEQAAKTLKSNQASKMIGLGLRWDYKSNNTGRPAVNIPDVINPGNKNKYGYYNQSINGQPLGQITPRFRELMQKATGVDMTNYDGAIINLYEKDTFISSHNDVDESKSAIKYPVIGINIGGKGNFSIERLGPENAMLNLEAGTVYIFGVDGINREVWHRTFPTPQDSFLPELTTKIDGKTYPAGSYRITITMRRVMPLESGMPEAPSIISEQPLREEDFNLELKDKITILEAELANLEQTKQEMLDRSVPVLIATNLPKIKPESARRETGVAVGTSKDINPGLLSNNGVSVERAAEMLSESLFYEGSGFPEIDVQEIRDYIIDILQTGVKNYVDEFTEQNKIDNLKSEIAQLKEEQRLSKDGNTGIQLDSFSDENAPEGYPSIPRTSKNCE
jgi:hypothetical protein